MHQPGLSADLDSFDLLDPVQVIQMTRRDLALVVRAGSQSLGVLRFSQGELLWAEFGTLRGEEAFMALAAQHTGSVEELVWDGHGERNVSQPLARLVMQAVEYRDAHDHRQPLRLPESEGSPVQPINSVPIPTQEHLNGPGSRPHLGRVSPETEGMLSDDETMPPWVRQIQAASEAFSSQPTTAIPPVPTASPASPTQQSPASFYSAQTEPLTPPPPGPSELPLSSLLQEEMAVQIPEPRVPLSMPNGKFALPSLANGGRTSPPPLSVQQDDPPTVPLPSVQTSLRDYAARREPPVSEMLRDSAPEFKLAAVPLPDQALRVRSMPAVAASPPPVMPALEALPDPTPPASGTPPDEPKMSSLSILEQLAYGGLANNGSADAASRDTSPAAPFASGAAESAAVALIVDRPPEHRASSRALNTEAFEQTDQETHAPAPAAIPATVGVSPPLSSSIEPASFPLSAEAQRQLQQALETFAEQVGAACIATAIIRSDGMLLAEYKVRRGQYQDLGSPAYHMAHVMQSSLRALLMGGWGDLEDTIITGSTHSVMLRRLGRAEKGLFHVAVLERSGNPGLCRVRMRNNEAALLQML